MLHELPIDPRRQPRHIVMPDEARPQGGDLDVGARRQDGGRIDPSAGAVVAAGRQQPVDGPLVGVDQPAHDGLVGRQPGGAEIDQGAVLVEEDGANGWCHRRARQQSVDSKA